MIRSVSRPLARTLRTYSTSSRSSPFGRNAAVASLTLAISGIAYVSSFDSQRLRADARDGLPDVLRNKNVKESVLDQPSLKEDIHKRHESEVKATPRVVEGKAEEASEEAQGAFNEETGEINWDCPCLGGMADGPCGEQFKAAFSCFVFSEQEPKGVDCVEKFKHMQDCFREHPDVYGEEIDDDEDDVSDEDPRPESQNPGGPKTPNLDPPANSPVLGVTPETTPSKGVTKIQATKNTGDKYGQSPSVGVGMPPEHRQKTEGKRT